MTLDLKEEKAYLLLNYNSLKHNLTLTGYKPQNPGLYPSQSCLGGDVYPFLPF